MPSPLTVYCPACDAALKLKDRQYIGKRVGCPKCRKPFVVADPGEAEDDFSALDEFDSYEDEADDEFEDEYERPARRSAPPGPAARRRSAGGGRASSSKSGRGSGKSRKTSRPQRSNLPFIIGGAVVGVGALVGLAFIVAGLLAKESVTIQEYSYLPPDSEGVMKMRLADVMNSPWQQQLVNPQQRQAMEMAKSQTGIDFMQIESITVGVSGLNPATLAGPGAGLGGPMNVLMNPNLKFVVLLRSRTDFPIDRIRNSSKALSHSGETYYMDKNGFPAAVYLPNDRTIVAGREMDVKRAIEQGAGAPSFQQFAFADLSQHMSVAFVPRDRSFLQTIEVPEVPGFPAVKKAGEALKTVLGAGFSLNYGADALDVHVSAKFGSDADAAQMKTALDELVPQGRAMLTAASGLADPQSAAGVATVGKVLETLAITQAGDTVSARLSLSREAAAQLQAMGEMQGF